MATAIQTKWDTMPVSTTVLGKDDSDWMEPFAGKLAKKLGTVLHLSLNFGACPFEKQMFVQKTLAQKLPSALEFLQNEVSFYQMSTLEELEQTKPAVAQQVAVQDEEEDDLATLLASQGYVDRNQALQAGIEYFSSQEDNALSGFLGASRGHREVQDTIPDGPPTKPELSGSIKCLVVGDALPKHLKSRFCAKSTGVSLDEFMGRDPDGAEPTTFTSYSLPMRYDNDAGRGMVEVEMWNTAGQEGFEQLRRLSYPGTDVFLFVYACDHPETLERLAATWLSEVRAECQEEPWILLIGVQSMETGYNPVTEEAVERVAKKINAIHSFTVDLDEQDDNQSGRDLTLDMLLTLGVMRLNNEPHPILAGDSF